MLVDFVVGGTQKGGTSALDLYLRHHPSIRMADRKELHFFDEDAFFTSGNPWYEYYHLQFSAPGEYAVTGEATPSYMFWEPAIERICRYNPRMKMILVLREPVARAYSHWNMEVQRRREFRPFREALACEGGRCKNGGRAERMSFSYASRGLYAKQLKHIHNYLPAEQIFVAFSELLTAQPTRVMSRIFGFLGVSDFSVDRAFTANARSYGSALSESDREEAAILFDEDIDELRELVRDRIPWDSP
jgi:hypothetical protein